MMNENPDLEYSRTNSSALALDSAYSLKYFFGLIKDSSLIIGCLIVSKAERLETKMNFLILFFSDALRRFSVP